VAKASVEIATGKKFVVGSDVDDSPMVHNDHAVSQRNHACTMGDHKRGAVARKIFERLEDELLTFYVDLAGGFVEQ
jgi:hypothetical protein